MTMDDAEPSTDAADEPEIQADEEWKQRSDRLPAPSRETIRDAPIATPTHRMR